MTLPRSHRLLMLVEADTASDDVGAVSAALVGRTVARVTWGVTRGWTLRFTDGTKVRFLRMIRENKKEI